MNDITVRTVTDKCGNTFVSVDDLLLRCYSDRIDSYAYTIKGMIKFLESIKDSVYDDRKKNFQVQSTCKSRG